MKLVKLFSFLLILTACSSVRYGHLTVRSHDQNTQSRTTGETSDIERVDLQGTIMEFRQHQQLSGNNTILQSPESMDLIYVPVNTDAIAGAPTSDTVNIQTIKDYQAAIDAVIPNDGDGPSPGMIILIVIISIVAVLGLIYLIIYLIALSIADSIAQSGCMVPLIAGASFVVYLFMN